MFANTGIQRVISWLLVHQLVFCGLIIPLSLADTPANCTYEDARGRWMFSFCDKKDCKEEEKKHIMFDMLYPNLAVDEYENRGTWTMIYNQGFEITVQNRKWLVMFAFNGDREFFCDRGMPGWTHDTLLRQWKWFTSVKLNPRKVVASTQDTLSKSKLIYEAALSKPVRSNLDFVNRINSVQNSWLATDYPELRQFSLGDLRRRAGGVKSVFSRPQHPLVRSTISAELLQAAAVLPEEFDWRFPKDGRPSPVTPVRNQGTCGSCYAFASLAALEARIRLRSNFTHQPILSPQDVVECGHYSEGCEGGFPYLVAGKYAEDYGIALESCNEYTGVDSKICKTKPNCTRYYATNYHYVGGYYGATNELLMKLELIHHGPFPVGFEVYDDFKQYRTGVYRHTQLKDEMNRFNPFELTNHAVVIVGYGFDTKSKLPYWTVKNSWGTRWGESGYFRILRGEDECGIESLAVSVDPVL
ncbi:unnamed protein product [Calicophoron daubneyi]|uniref:Dipeptidyl peptidase 1 n=1 Tax=Calicophoron daubneyi TaxID=300641 RepID=A0AAV2T6H4_CALDB